MSLNHYIIIVLVLSVQATTNERFKHYLKETKRNLLIPIDESKLFENIREPEECKTTTKMHEVVSSTEPCMRELKTLLLKLLVKLENIESSGPSQSSIITESRQKTMYTSATYPSKKASTTTISSGVTYLDMQKDKRNEGQQISRWGYWTMWSPCSVSCGRGREIRWRHCLTDCDNAETEMEEKACQLPACGPGKFFGIQL